MQPKELEKIFANWISYKELIYKVYKKITETQGQKKKQPTWFKNRQNTRIDISPEKIYKWPISTWKDVQHH